MATNGITNPAQRDDQVPADALVSRVDGEPLRSAIDGSILTSRRSEASAAPQEQVKPVLSARDTEVVEHVLGMRTGYVLDFSDRTFDNFIAAEIGIDATAPRFSVNGGSKARRLRAIIQEQPPAKLGHLLRAFMEYRDNPAHREHVEVLDDEWRHAYAAIVQKLELSDPAVEERIQTDPPAVAIDASSWTGRRTVRQQTLVIRQLVPLALEEIDQLANLIESKRFNDDETADEIRCLRELHSALGELLNMVNRGELTREAVAAIEVRRQQLLAIAQRGAKMFVVAPVLAAGLVQVISFLNGVAVDSTLVAAALSMTAGPEVAAAIHSKIKR